MKRTLFLLFAILGTLTTYAEPPAPAPTLLLTLSSFEWSWLPASKHKEKSETIRFYRDGIFSERLFAGRWEATGLRTVTLQSKKSGHKAFLTFNADLTSYEGVGFDGSSRISGTRLGAVDPNATYPEPPALSRRSVRGLDPCRAVAQRGCFREG